MERAKLISIQLLFGLPSHCPATGLGSRVCDVTKDVCDVTAAEAWAGLGGSQLHRPAKASEVLDAERVHLLQGAIQSEPAGLGGAWLRDRVGTEAGANRTDSKIVESTWCSRASALVLGVLGVRVSFSQASASRCFCS